MKRREHTHKNIIAKHYPLHYKAHPSFQIKLYANLSSWEQRVYLQSHLLPYFSFCRYFHSDSLILGIREFHMFMKLHVNYMKYMCKKQPCYIKISFVILLNDFRLHIFNSEWLNYFCPKSWRSTLSCVLEYLKADFARWFHSCYILRLY